MTIDLSHDQLKQILRYEPETGKWFWLVNRSSYGGKARAGAEAGYKHADGRVVMVINGKHYYAHRLAFLYMTGVWPKNQIDHINVNNSDNRWSNLREATYSQNHGNKRPKLQGRLKGATYDRARGMWQARLCDRHLGRFSTEIEAHEAYCAAAKKHFGEFFRAA